MDGSSSNQKRLVIIPNYLSASMPMTSTSVNSTGKTYGNSTAKIVRYHENMTLEGNLNAGSKEGVKRL